MPTLWKLPEISTIHSYTNKAILTLKIQHHFIKPLYVLLSLLCFVTDK